MSASRASCWLLLSLALGAAAGEPSIVVLADGQTLEGEVTVQSDGSVRLRVPARSGEGQPFEVTLAPEAVEKVLPAGSLQREVVPRGVVELTDGRELRGEVLASETTVVVRGPFGQVEVARADVVAVRPEEPEPPHTCADADLGLSLRVPDGWSTDEPGGVGERLRLVRGDGRVSLSVLVRVAPAEGSPPERVRAALAHDLVTDGVGALQGDLVGVTDATVDHAARQRPLRIQGSVELRGELAVWYRAEIDGELDTDPALQQQLERLIASRTWLESGRTKDASLWRDAGLRLAVEAPPGWRLADPNEAGQVARMESPAVRGGSLRVHTVEDPDQEAALRDLLEEQPEEVRRVDLEGVTVVRCRSATERGLAYAWGGKTVVVIARAPRAEELVRLIRGVLLIDPADPLQEARDACALLPRRAAARKVLAKDPQAALAELEEVFAGWPDDPESLQIRVGALRDRVPTSQLVEALDDAWYAYASPWTSEELAEALVERAREEAGRKDHVAASESYARAAEVWLDDDLASEIESYYVGLAKASLAAGDKTLAWAKLATARKVLGAQESLDEVEAGMRLQAARAELKAEDPQGARREARKAYLLGADEKVVDQIYAQAESLEIRLEKTKAAEAARRRAAAPGGLEFGIPPSLANRAGLRTVRPSSMLRSNGRGRRVRNPSYSSGRSRRVRPAFSNDNRSSGRMRRARARNGGGRSRRVRSNGQLVFEPGS